MNTPDPSPKPDPTTPGPQAKPTALTAAATTALAGTPVSIIVLWLLTTYGTVHGKPLTFDPITASAMGSGIAALAGYLWRVAQALLHKWGIDPGP